MNHSRFTFCLLFGLSFPAAPLLLADDAASASKSLEPLQILEECVQSIQTRNFARYVDHLSNDEQQVQAGYALLQASILARSADAGADLHEPETILLGRSLKDVVQIHRLWGASDSEYAIAVSADSETDGQEAAPALVDLQPLPMEGQVNRPLNISFRRIDGVWKIDRLLPSSALSRQLVRGPVVDACYPVIR